MPLYIKDDEADALAAKVKELTGAANKTEAVKMALRHEVECAARQTPLRERLQTAWRIVDALGPAEPDFDMKRFTDELWGEI